MMSEILTTDSAAKVLRELLPAQNRSSFLGLALGLKDYEVKAIHTANSHPEECLREVIISFLQQAPESKRNWMFIADALAGTLVKHLALAETLRADHCSITAPNEPAPINPTTLTDGVLSNTSGVSTVAMSASTHLPPHEVVNPLEHEQMMLSEVAAQNQLATTAPDQLTIPPSNDRSQPVALNTVSDVKTAILRLETKFSKLTSQTRAHMCAKESQDREFIDEFRDHLLLLPVTKKAPHVKFFRENEDDILEARNIRKLFAILSRYMTFRNYEILREIIAWLDVGLLHQSMQDYSRMLLKFELSTTVDVYISAVPEEVTEEQKKAFSEMVLRINKPASQCTLHDVRKLNEALIASSAVCPHSVYISGLANKCVEVVVGFPSTAVGWMLGAMTPDFMTRHQLTKVVVDGRQLTVVQGERHQLNDWLIEATEEYEGDVMRVAALLNSGANIHTLGGQYTKTALDLASYRGHVQIVRLLSVRGSEVERRDENGWTPLISAAHRGYCDVVKDLLALGADVNAQNNYGRTPLWWAAQNGHCDVVKDLLELGADVNAQDNDGDSALVIAANLGRTDVVVELVKAGASLDLQNKAGDSAAMRAVQFYRSAPLRELVRAGCDLNLQNQEGLTALMMAVRSGRSDITDILLEAGVIDLDIQENQTGWLALSFAVERGDTATVRALVTAGASTLLTDRNGLTALELASASGNDTDEMCELLTHTSATPQSHPSTDETNQQEPPPPADQDSTAREQASPPIQEAIHILDTTQITSRQRRQRNISNALRNLVNRSREVAVQIFNDLDRRLKSTDKDQSEVRGQGRDIAAVEKKRKGKEQSDNQTSTFPVKYGV